MKHRVLLLLAVAIGLAGTPAHAADDNASGWPRNHWYQESFYNWFMTHHVAGTEEVGKDIDVAAIKAFLRQQDPDYIAVHARGPMGWALYPTEVGYPLPKLKVDLVQVFADIAEEMDKPLVIYYNLGRDKEIEKRRPEWNRLDVDGQLYPMSLSYLTDVKKEYLWPQIREIMLKYHPDAFWFDGSVYSVWPCFREATRAHFKERTGHEAPTSPDSPLWNAYREMHRQVWREFTDQTTDFVHAIDPACLVSYNMSYTVWMPEKPDGDVDFTTMDLGHLAEDISLVTRFTDTQGIPFEILLPVRFFHVEQGTLLRPLEQMKQDTAQVIANGGKLGVWDQPSTTTVFLPGHQETLIELSQWVHARKPWCHGTTSLPDASVLHIAGSHYLPDDRFERFPNCHSTAHFCYAHENVRTRGACYGLNRHHVHNSVIADWRLREGPVTVSLLVVEDPKLIPPDVVAAIADCARRGGRVLLTGASAAVPEIAELAGIDYAAAMADVQGYTAQLGDGQDARFRHRFHRVGVIQARAVQMVKDEAEGRAHVFLTQRSSGKGQVFYCAAPIFTNYSFTDVPPAIIESVLDTVLPRAQRQLLVDGPSSIEVSLRRKDHLRLVHLVNRAEGEVDGVQFTRRVRNIPPAPACHLALQVPSAPTAVTLEPGGRPVSYRYVDGRVEMDVPGFDFHEIVCVALPMP